MSVIENYLQYCRQLIETVSAQNKTIGQAAGWFAHTILQGRMVQVFGSGHSRIMVEEMWPRYGSFPGFNPIVELSLTFHNLVVGANGQRQAMFLENVSGLADRILRNFDLHSGDSALVVSNSGCNAVPVEMARGFRDRGLKVVVIVSLAHLEESTSKLPDGKKLTDYADLVLDTGAPVGDAVIKLPGMEAPVAPTSTIGGAMIINCLKAEVARLLTEAGQPPNALAAPALVGKQRSQEIFESAYDEHAHRLAGIFQNVGK